MTKDEIVKEIDSWTDEKTDYYANTLDDFSHFYGVFSDIVIDTQDQFQDEEDPNVTFLSIISGLAESILIAIPEKDVKYYAMIAVIHDTIKMYQQDY